MRCLAGYAVDFRFVCAYPDYAEGCAEDYAEGCVEDYTLGFGLLGHAIQKK